jgi:predicted transcriptional regulator
MAINYNKPIIVRDFRNGGWYWIHKEVIESDKISASDKLVYNALAYFANNESQEAYPSLSTIAKLIKVSRRTVVTSIKNLHENDFISKDVAKGKVTTYTLCKIYTSAKSAPVQNSTYTGANKSLPPVQNSTTNNTNKTTLNKKKIVSPKDDAPFNLKKELQKLKDSPQRHIQLVGEYLEEKKIVFETKDQLKVAMKRHMRASVELSKFSDKQIGKATKQVMEEYPSYTLETLIKVLTR